MKRFISNYTILASGELMINHITTVDDDNTLVSIEPFDRELGNTIYVPKPLCITSKEHLHIVEKSFDASASRSHFIELLKQHNINMPHREQRNILVLSLDFNTKSLSQL